VTVAELPFGLGLIEGFYGRPWGAADREAMLGFLGSIGYEYYVYAPKADATLRRGWSERWDPEGERCLQSLARRCHGAGLKWGVGLSPLGLVETLSAPNRRRLREKIRYIDQFSPEILCILFDDMPRAIERLAAGQLAVVEDVLATTRARHVVVCPSYYTSDPVLERLFGSMPPGYWSELGKELPKEVGIFWTGERVCSASYDCGALARIGEVFGRAPVLWDNYPVNDGARMSKFLHLDAFRGRPPELAQLTRAHFVNPMNQCWLSRIPLATLTALYREGREYEPRIALERSLRDACGEDLAEMLLADLAAFQARGLDGITQAEKNSLSERYRGVDSPFAREIADWLDGGYAFDPACLTD